MLLKAFVSFALIVPSMLLSAKELNSGKTQFLANLQLAGTSIAKNPCAKPKVLKQIKPNLHDPSIINTTVTRFCTHSSSIWTMSNVIEAPVFVKISRYHKNLENWAQVGKDIGEILTNLGRPDKVAPNYILYYFESESKNEFIIFRHNNRKVKAVEWYWYLD